jgi:hypothetical protein
MGSKDVVGEKRIEKVTKSPPVVLEEIKINEDPFSFIQ